MFLLSVFYLPSLLIFAVILIIRNIKFTGGSMNIAKIKKVSAFLIVFSVTLFLYLPISAQPLAGNGWIDDDTFQFEAVGVASQKLTNKVLRRESAKRASVLNAQYFIHEKFKNEGKREGEKRTDSDLSGVEIRKEIESLIKAGSIISVTFDEEENAEILYQITLSGLKNKVASAVWDSENNTIQAKTEQPKAEEHNVREGIKIGEVFKLDQTKSEVIIRGTDFGKTVKLGDILYFRVEGKVVMIRVTFNMMASARCVAEGSNKEMWTKAQKSMLVYKWDKNIADNAR